ncbi:MAG: ubiquinone biosynthesis protein UbiA [Cytophagales bacterium]|nr:MAG: ubiquinone biosynthesis protein UbiA [Cytophagales bacterium]TAF60381.1 MAG: ubiquinone biosynthesis protein UbiA [Cytophagales bacterium]
MRSFWPSISTIKHLRIPFSVFLMPIFSFAAACSEQVNLLSYVEMFVILHVLVYPASNGYNSYYDRDEGSIGGLKHPPKVTEDLLYWSLALDALALAYGWFRFGTLFALLLLVYGLASKAYSHPSIRLKKRTWISLFTIGFFQGSWTFLMVWQGLDQLSLSDITLPNVWWPALLCFAFLSGSYPMTQIYQHKEDASRGDQTVSLRLGILGTFVFTGVCFLFTMAGFAVYFLKYFSIKELMLFQIFLSPTLLFFMYWFWSAYRNPSKANFQNTMWLNLLSALGMIGFFSWLMWTQQH